LNTLSLFSGIGGLDLGLERAGHMTIGQVEINDYCNRVLAKHWPDVPRHDDVRTCVEWWRSESRPTVELIAGGFPCQPHSSAGRQRGDVDERYGWGWFADVIRELEPACLIIENVPNLIHTGFRTVLSDLDSFGFHAWWTRVPAAAFGAPHLRWRLITIAAHPDRINVRKQPRWASWTERTSTTLTGYNGATWSVANPGSELGVTWESLVRGRDEEISQSPESGRRSSCGGVPRAWTLESDVGRVAYGIPKRLDRMRVLGNAVVPAVGEYAGRLLNELVSCRQEESALLSDR
jgi:DNA (cytosine-5)-methyltransferase 1